MTDSPDGLKSARQVCQRRKQRLTPGEGSLHKEKEEDNPEQGGVSQVEVGGRVVGSM